MPETDILHIFFQQSFNCKNMSVKNQNFQHDNLVRKLPMKLSQSATAKDTRQSKQPNFPAWLKIMNEIISVKCKK